MNQSPFTDPQVSESQNLVRADAGQHDVMLLRARVADVMAIENTHTDASSNAVAFTGILKQEAEHAFEMLKQRFTELGYIALLRETPNGERQVVVAIKGSAQAMFNTAFKQRHWLNLGLFLATVATTTIFGGMYAAALSQGRAPALNFSTILTYGLPFAATLLTILGVHEFGHYVQAKRHNLPVSLPFFIPVPFGLGTFGAFIQMRGAVQNKRALFDVGIGGPIAGVIVAIPLFVVGLLMATIANSPAPDTRSLMMEALISIFRPEGVANGIELNPVLLAARFGLILTAVNLMPIGQLDGGHIAYAALGQRWARWVSYATMGVLLVLGLTVSTNWLVWLLFAGFTGVQHAAPLNDVTRLDLRRNLAFLATFVLFLSLFSTAPY